MGMARGISRGAGPPCAPWAAGDWADIGDIGAIDGAEAGSDGSLPTPPGTTDPLPSGTGAEAQGPVADCWLPGC